MLIQFLFPLAIALIPITIAVKVFTESYGWFDLPAFVAMSQNWWLIIGLSTGIIAYTGFNDRRIAAAVAFVVALGLKYGVMPL